MRAVQIQNLQHRAIKEPKPRTFHLPTPGDVGSYISGVSRRTNDPETDSTEPSLRGTTPPQKDAASHSSGSTEGSSGSGAESAPHSSSLEGESVDSEEASREVGPSSSRSTHFQGAGGVQTSDPETKRRKGEDGSAIATSYPPIEEEYKSTLLDNIRQAIVNRPLGPQAGTKRPPEEGFFLRHKTVATTHADRDHYNLIPQIFDTQQGDYAIENLVLSGSWGDYSKTFRKWVRESGERIRAIFCTGMNGAFYKKAPKAHPMATRSSARQAEIWSKVYKLIIILGMTYSVYFRREVLSVRAQEGLSMKEVAQRFDVSDAGVMCWVKEVVPRSTWNKAIKIDMEALAQDGAEHPDHYYYERAAPFSVSSTCICKALKRLGVTYKKKSSASQGTFRGTYSLSGKASKVPK